MSILSDLDAMVLRDTSNPPLTDKGSELTYAEFDGNFVKLYDAVQSIVSGQGVTAYDAGATYDMFSTDIRERYASYDSRIWKAVYVGSPSGFSGETPAEGIYWTQVTLAEMIPNLLELARLAERMTGGNSPCPVYCASLTIASADVRQLNSTPLTVVSGITGAIIDPISIVVSLDFNTTPYATESDLAFRHNGSSSKIAQETMLDVVSSVIGRFGLIANANSDQYVSGAALEVYCPNADPTAGNSNITVRVLYRIINV